MASNSEEIDSTDRIVADDPISDINTEDGRGPSRGHRFIPSPSPFRDSHLNEFVNELRPIQDSSELNDSLNSGEFMSNCFRISINGTRFHFLREFHLVFDKLFFYSGHIAESPFDPITTLRENLKCRNDFVQHKRSPEPITSIQRIVTHILSIMPVYVRKKLAGRIQRNKDLRPRPKAGPSGFSAQRSRSYPPRDAIFDFYSYFMDSPESIGSPWIYSEYAFPRQWTREEQLQVEYIKSRIGVLTCSVLEDLKIIKDVADLTLRQYESGDGLDLVKTLDYLEKYQDDYGTKEEIFEDLARVVANDCEKYLQSTFKILDLRRLMNIYEKSRSRIQYAIFLLKIDMNIDTEVNDVSINIRSLVGVARSFSFWTKEK